MVLGLLIAVASPVEHGLQAGAWTSVVAAHSPQGVGSVVVVHGLVAEASSWTRDQICVLCIVRHRLNHFFHLFNVCRIYNGICSFIPDAVNLYLSLNHSS